MEQKRREGEKKKESNKKMNRKSQDVGMGWTGPGPRHRCKRPDKDQTTVIITWAAGGRGRPRGILSAVQVEFAADIERLIKASGLDLGAPGIELDYDCCRGMYATVRNIKIKLTKPFSSPSSF